MRASVFHRQQDTTTSAPTTSGPVASGTMTSGTVASGPMAPPDSPSPDPRSPAPATDEGAGVAALLERRQAMLRDRVAAAGASGSGTDAVDAHDSMVAAVSGHLAISATLLLPLARRRLPGGSSGVHDLARHGRHLERELVVLQGRLHGDNASRRASIAELREEVAEQVRNYCTAEMELARQLDGVLTAEQARRLDRGWAAAGRHAPTRPHPYSVHSRGLGRLVLLGDALWDNALDLMDNRSVPSERPPRKVRPLTAWGRYLTGTADFDTERRS